MADTAFEKAGGALTQRIQINGFWPEFYIKKVKFVEKKGGGRGGKSATGLGGNCFPLDYLPDLPLKN